MRKAFTLVELLIVLAILGILISLIATGIAKFSGAENPAVQTTPNYQETPQQPPQYQPQPPQFQASDMQDIPIVINGDNFMIKYRGRDNVSIERVQ